MVSNDKQGKASVEESGNEPKASPAKPSWKGKRGRMLQEMGAALLAEPGNDEERLARFLDKEDK